MTVLCEGLKDAGLPEDAIQLVPTRDRAAVSEMLTMTDTIDVIVPRGGKGLVGLVQREARVPVFAHLEGIVHIYIDASADPDKALARGDERQDAAHRHLWRGGMFADPSVMLLDTIGRTIIEALIDAGVEVRGDAELAKIAG